VCDGRLRFRFFSACSTGSTHDSASLAMTALGERLSKGHGPGGIPSPYFFAGDAAYTLSNALVVPVSGAAEGSANCNFNMVHSQYRATIERAFGCLVRRFGVLWRPLSYSVAMNTSIIRCVVRLHNICMSRPRGGGEVVEPPHELDIGLAPSDADIQSLLETEMEVKPSTRHDGSATRNRLVRAVDEAGIQRRAV
jgi:hypothetical protein